MAKILEITTSLTEIRWLLGMSSMQIVEHLLSGYKGNVPTFDGLRVIKKDNLITCDLFSEGCASSTYQSSASTVFVIDCLSGGATRLRSAAISNTGVPFLGR
jgi:hypothetical protein